MNKIISLAILFTGMILVGVLIGRNSVFSTYYTFSKKEMDKVEQFVMEGRIGSFSLIHVENVRR